MTACKAGREFYKLAINQNLQKGAQCYGLSIGPLCGQCFERCLSLQDVVSAGVTCSHALSSLLLHRHRRACCIAGARTRTEQAAHEKKEAAVIGRDDSTAAEVSSANAKLAAEALLRGLSKRMDNSIMHELEVVAVSADVDTAKLTLLRKGWYQQATYFFE